MKNYWMWNKGDFLKLHNLETFNKVNPVFDTIQWDNGLEIVPEELHDESVMYHSQTSAM